MSRFTHSSADWHLAGQLETAAAAAGHRSRCSIPPITIELAQAVIERERRGDYLGKTVQVVPHITDAIQDWIERVAALPVDGRSGMPAGLT